METNARKGRRLGTERLSFVLLRDAGTSNLACLLFFFFFLFPHRDAWLKQPHNI